ncbi:YibE/F family protein [Alkaliphilus metalliredigens QYMF]|uniref:YibE/F family protein n=1 Tax=Alkaliphilus metalliredigens (strain QYMF) TaxID=293826 RepID=A6TJB0_ALKMQ|nr:YibE/F family protein [Alkaliphilus metalliredigens]ABR46278.1 YibE/F family protein [Alkaliphilus metalliredigens QYMF]
MINIKQVKMILVIALLVGILGASLAHGETSNEHIQYKKARAIILEVQEEQEGQLVVQWAKARVMNGPLKGHIIQLKHPLIKGSKYHIELEENMRIFLELRVEENRVTSANFIDVTKEHHLKILLAIFVTLLLIFGGFKGLRSFIALVITGLCMLYIFIPMVFNGYSFILATVVVSGIIIVSSFILISGFTTKSLTAIIGTIGGTTISGVIAIYFGNLMYLTGITDDAIETLIRHSTLDVDYRGLLYSGMTIGALGAVMDVSMTITSVIYEIKRGNRQVRIKSLVLSGLAVGRDIMATMTNTLILAYAGTSLPLLLLFIFSEMPLEDIINSQYIASEVVRALSGSIGLVLTIPITSVVAAINIKWAKE